MPPYIGTMPQREHLRRLNRVWIRHPVYFLTVCTDRRRPILTKPGLPAILIAAWQASSEINGWAVGRFVVMPDHVHFFSQSINETKTLDAFLRDWKRWTAGEIKRTQPSVPVVWQTEFFDHVLRSVDSYEQKWNYVRNNPVRAGLVSQASEWPYAGECVQLHCSRSL